jgi:hypothetical protein
LTVFASPEATDERGSMAAAEALAPENANVPRPSMVPTMIVQVLFNIILTPNYHRRGSEMLRIPIR